MSGAVKNLARSLNNSEFTWRYVSNLMPTLSYKLHRQSIGGEAARVLENLNRFGIAVTTVNDLFPNDPFYPELASTAADLEREFAWKIESMRAILLQPGQDQKSKSFFLDLLGDMTNGKSSSIYERFILRSPVTEIANAYFGMQTALRYYNVWHTLASDTPARDSQLWHRDPDDRYILKVFVNLSNVDEESGPFTYVPGTHPKGLVRDQPEFIYEQFDSYRVRRTTDEQMEKVVPKGNWISCVGARGTMVFADTRGFHKGGHARLRDRLVFASMFTSYASIPPGKDRKTTLP
jgi:Phytanoyl-CoA dioxygenase (PhyH)